MEKLLIVDDEPGIVDMMKSYFSPHYEVLTAYSGTEALERASSRPDLILLDYEMPVCKGSQILEMIRSEKDFADIPVIFLTTRDDHESVKKVLALKANGYLLKYLKPTEIKKRIDEFFKSREA